jgi:hypothetical protein
MCLIQTIKSKSGKPFRDTMRECADLGWSISYTAIAYDVSRSQLRIVCDRMKVKHHFKPQGQQIEVCRPGNQTGRGWPKGKKRSLG